MLVNKQAKTSNFRIEQTYCDWLEGCW